jgi:hypothetical protein
LIFTALSWRAVGLVFNISSNILSKIDGDVQKNLFGFESFVRIKVMAFSSFCYAASLAVTKER